MIEVDYTIMCKSDVALEVSLEALLSNEKVAKAIKAEFAKGVRNLALKSRGDATILLQTDKVVHTFRVSKNDFADLLELAEEDARKHKRFKKECEGVMLVDIRTIDESKEAS